MSSARHQREGGQHLGQRRMLFVEAHVELLQVAYAGANVRHLVDGDRLAEGGATGQQEHHDEQQKRHDGNTEANRHRLPFYRGGQGKIGRGPAIRKHVPTNPGRARQQAVPALAAS